MKILNLPLRTAAIAILPLRTVAIANITVILPQNSKNRIKKNKFKKQNKEKYI